jgi:hypothetical protein
MLSTIEKNITKGSKIVKEIKNSNQTNKKSIAEISSQCCEPEENSQNQSRANICVIKLMAVLKHERWQLFHGREAISTQFDTIF